MCSTGSRASVTVHGLHARRGGSAGTVWIDIHASDGTLKHSSGFQDCDNGYSQASDDARTLDAMVPCT